MTDAVIRRAEHADLAVIVQLRREWTREEHGDIADPDFEENLAAWFAREWSRRIIWLAEVAGRPVDGMDEALLAEARQAQERLIDAERDADVFRAEFHRAVRRLHLHGASLRELASGLGLSHQRVHQIVESAGGSRRWLRRDRPRPDPGLLHCTFCGKNQKQVKKLIAGPNVYICDGCTGLAKVVISDGLPVTTEIAELTAGSGQEPRTQCSFCGKRRDQVASLVVSSVQTERKAPATICSECLDLCTEIITEELGETPR